MEAILGLTPGNKRSSLAVLGTSHLVEWQTPRRLPYIPKPIRQCESRSATSGEKGSLEGTDYAKSPP